MWERASDVRLYRQDEMGQLYHCISFYWLIKQQKSQSLADLAGILQVWRQMGANHMEAILKQGEGCPHNLNELVHGRKLANLFEEQAGNKKLIQQ